MAHVTFIHGIANKPPADDLLQIWRRAVAEAAEPLPLGDLGVTSSIVYWADLLYGAPVEDVSAFEAALENTAEVVDGAGGAAPPVPHTPEEAAFLGSLRAKMTSLPDEAIDAEPIPAAPGQPQGALERVPLPWFVKKRFLNAFLRDVHHYLFDVEFAPPGGTAVRIQQTIRQRFVDGLGVPSVTRPHVVVAHSLGTVIAYDCMKRVAGCQPVDGFITLGSPLGLDEVQDKLQPGWSRSSGFPHETLTGGWVNLFDRLDPVCGLDPVLGNDFCRSDAVTVEDVAVQNHGAWRHSATKYLRQPAFTQALRRLLQL